MAEREEKIFPALPQRRQRAREQGQVARSSELTGAFAFAVVALGLCAGVRTWSALALSGFGAVMNVSGASDLAGATRFALLKPLAWAILFGLVLAAVALLGATLQGGFLFTPARLVFDPARLNPAKYLARTFSSASWVELGRALLKIVPLLFVGWAVARDALERYPADGGVSKGLALWAWSASRVLLAGAVLALAVGVIDYLHRWHEQESELRMTRQEFRDELRREEGDPHVRRVLRRMLFKRFRRFGGMHQAASASVVLTNPTHLALALRYRRGFDPAPLVVAKGAGAGAARIVAVARLAAVPVVENRPLAQALFRAAEVGDFIPRAFYRAIAEVLALIMRGRPPRASETGAAQNAPAQT